MSAFPAPARDPLAAVRGEQGFPADPDFPQLEIASDPARMLEVFRAHLEPVAGHAYHVDSCVPVRFRCRQSTTRCVLQYSLRVVDRSTERAFNQSVTGVVYSRRGEAERLWRELGTTHPRRSISDCWLTFEPLAYVPELEMLVQVFPYDRQLHGLGQVLAGEGREFAPLLQASAGAGDWRPGAGRLDLLRYRAEIGAALRYTLELREVRSGRTETRRCYVKVCRPGRGAATFQLMTSLCAAQGGATSAYAVVRPLAHLDALDTLVVEEAPGTALLELLRGRDDPTRAVQAAARALAAFNLDCSVRGPRDFLAEQIDDIERGASLLAWACPEVSGDLRAIAATVVADLTDAPPASIHGDAKADHLFVAGDRVTFIDFDRLAVGDPVRDPARLCAYLTGRVGLDAVPAERAQAATAVFVDEYFAHVPAEWRERFSLQYAAALLDVASGLFRSQEAGWRGKVSAAVAEACGALSPRWT
ncbi:MAG TPA: phosphotransferase [Gemmatimonadales bacterium]|nr:phosphotransferase [Gemmatimonadales bacterium]